MKLAALLYRHHSTYYCSKTKLHRPSDDGITDQNSDGVKISLRVFPDKCIAIHFSRGYVIHCDIFCLLYTVKKKVLSPYTAL